MTTNEVMAIREPQEFAIDGWCMAGMFRSVLYTAVKAIHAETTGQDQERPSYFSEEEWQQELNARTGMIGLAKLIVDGIKKGHWVEKREKVSVDSCIEQIKKACAYYDTPYAERGTKNQVVMLKSDQVEAMAHKAKTTVDKLDERAKVQMAQITAADPFEKYLPEMIDKIVNTPFALDWKDCYELVGPTVVMKLYLAIGNSLSRAVRQVSPVRQRFWQRHNPNAYGRYLHYCDVLNGMTEDVRMYYEEHQDEIDDQRFADFELTILELFLAGEEDEGLDTELAKLEAEVTAKAA